MVITGLKTILGAELDEPLMVKLGCNSSVSFPTMPVDRHCWTAEVDSHDKRYLWVAGSELVFLPVAKLPRH